MSSVIESRHKTAMSRTDFSRPVRLALHDGLINANTSVFDYGCGKGDDIRRLTEQGIQCVGWDPVHGDDRPVGEFDIVNLGYVINVIEQPRERAEVLRDAWKCAATMLVVSARLAHETNGEQWDSEADGLVTSRGTFQKFFVQAELRDWIDTNLDASSVAAAPGVFYVFRDEGTRQAYLATRQRHRLAVPRVRRSDQLYEEHRGLLEQLSQFLTDRGRLPEDSELDCIDELNEKLGSVRRAYGILRHVVGVEQWNDIRAVRADDLQIFLALARFGKRPRWSDLPFPMQRDVKAFFSSYTKACTVADDLLFALGKGDRLGRAFEECGVGRQTDRALYVHSSALQELPPLLRVYEGAAREYIGAVEGANVLKLHKIKPAVTYMSYEGFDDVPHPTLVDSLRIELHTFNVKTRDFREWPDPPVLSRKEELVHSSYPSYEKFARLSRQEEKRGILDQPGAVSSARGLEAQLNAKGVRLRGHQLVRA